ncbi:cysteine desulfurase family protein [Aestuariibius sp. 2305UL40-4]|uniref:cysteine desulfurase family protein n=1 Tax=Aestuariibius violaceus TaxID=3234132 RepID=UPI00345EE732
MRERVYLDWNATAPLRAEVREAMIAAMDVVGNPSSVHSEGRAAKAIVERARAQVARLVGAEDDDVIFVSSATEAAALALAGHRDVDPEKDAPDADGRPWHVSTLANVPQTVISSEIEHDCVAAWRGRWLTLKPWKNGRINWKQVANLTLAEHARVIVAVQAANSETGVLQPVDKFAAALDRTIPRPLLVSDAVQAIGKIAWRFDRSRADMALVSAHKFGGPKGVGALIVKRGLDVAAQLKGGGQEMGRRSGTENVIGIAGFGAAAEAAARDLEAGVWDRVAEFRNILEKTIEARAPETIFVGKDVERLPNTSCMIAPGWKGETQVMAMDLAGFAISAGSACSSGKVRASRVLSAMGYSEAEAASAVRVSLGPTTTEDEVLRFADVWTAACEKHRARAA